MLYFVGVGPGDPELITMKAVRILQEADAIVLPDSGKDSVVWQIIQKWVDNKQVYSVSMPMQGARHEWQAAHDLAAKQIGKLLEKHNDIAYPVLGDPGIYASGSYLIKRLSAYHACEVIPGVPAMCAAAAALGIPLCEQHEDLWITDRADTATVPANTNAVLMKSGKKISVLKETIPGGYVAKNLGMNGQWLGKLEDFPDDTVSYFTTVIVKT